MSQFVYKLQNRVFLLKKNLDFVLELANDMTNPTIMDFQRIWNRFCYVSYLMADALVLTVDVQVFLIDRCMFYNLK